MSDVSEHVLAQLSIVERERRQRASTPGLDANVEALKAFQQRRFARTYADLLEQSRYRAACSFFLEELYGPRDYTRRDNQFAKVVPALARLFPSEIVQTVDRLAELHALSEVLDTAMALQLPAGPVRAPHYVCAWQAVGREADRRRQIKLILSIAERLHHFTLKPLLRRSLQLMRGPTLGGPRRTAAISRMRLRRLSCHERGKRISRHPAAARDIAGQGPLPGRSERSSRLIRSPPPRSWLSRSRGRKRG